MATLNRRLGPPEVEAAVWTGGVGVNTSLVDGNSGLSARAVVVSTPGTLVLVDIYGTVRTFTAAEITALGNIIRGQWVQVTAAGSTAHTLIVWW